MIQKRDLSEDTTIKDYLSKIPMSLEVKNGKIIKIEYDDSKLTPAQKLAVSTFLNNNNPNLVDF